MQAAGGDCALSGLLTVEMRESDEIYFSLLAALHQTVGETGSREADETGSGRVDPLVSCPQVADPAETLQVPQSHLLVPLCLADGQERGPGAIGVAEDSDVDLMHCLVPGIADGAGSNLNWPVSESVAREVQRPLPAEALEVRAQDVAREPALTALLHLLGTCAAHELWPQRPRDRVEWADRGRIRGDACCDRRGGVLPAHALLVVLHSQPG